MSRSIPEWVGRTDDSAIPEKVALRVFEANERKCFLCGNLIRPGDGMDIHHKVPLIDGGRHAEYNLVPVHRKCHRLQTAREAQDRAQHRSTVKSHYGLRKKRGFQSRGFPPAQPQHSATRPIRRDR